MKKRRNRRFALMTVVALTVFSVATFPCISTAAGSAIDPQADQILKNMCEYLGSLKQFSVHTQNTLEDVLDSGNRVDYEVSAEVFVSRPDKLRAERKGDLVDQMFFYDGKTLTLYNPFERAPWSH